MCLPQYKPVEDYDCVELPHMSIPDVVNNKLCGDLHILSPLFWVMPFISVM